MAKKDENIGVNANQTSSAATNYGDADGKWLKQIPGTNRWVAFPSVNIEEIVENIKEMVVSGIKGDIVKNIGGWITSNIKNIIGKGKKILSNQINAILTVKNKMLGQFNTAEGQGLAIFGALSAAVIGGGVLLGAGPEVITGMLRMYQIGYTLNLKQTDEQIEQEIQGSFTSLYASSGETLGMGLASFVSGGVFQIPRVKINMTKVSILWRTLNEEARIQLLSQIKNLGRTAFFTGLRIMAKVFYRSTRKMLKQLALTDPNHPLIKLIPGGAKSVEQWGSGGEPWSLSLYVQNKIENIQANPLTKNIGVFLENFVEGFGEGIQEFLPDLVRQPMA